MTGKERMLKDRMIGQCLENASPGGGYIFGTSNTIFPGMPLAHYPLSLLLTPQPRSR